MSNTLEAKLKLDIAELIANQAKARAETKSWIDDLRAEGKRGATAVDSITAAHKRLEASIQKTNAVFSATKAVNPWATASAGAMAYAKILEERVAKNLRMDQLAASTAAPVLSGNQGLRNQAAGASRYSQATASASSRRSGGGGNAIGGISMQAQDIAVQLQSGTSAAVVLGQQGSQLLSIFGPGGALLGGAVAVGAAFYTMGQKATEAFKASKAEAAAFDGEMRGALLGTTKEIVGFWSQVGTKIQAATSDMQDLNQGWSGIGARLAALAGGPSVESRMQVANEMRIKGENALATIQQNILAASAKEVEIAKLRAAGLDKAADAMERQAALAKEIAGIQGSGLPQGAQARLIADAQTRSTLDGTTPGTAKKDAAEKLKALVTLRAESKQIAQDMLPDNERLAALKKQLADLMRDAQFKALGSGQTLDPSSGAAGLSSLAGAHAASGNKTAEIDALQAYKTALALQKEIADVQKTAQQSAQQAADKLRATQVQALMQMQAKAIDQQQEDTAKKKQLFDQQELAAIMRAEELRATGHTKEAAAQERRIRLVQDAKRIEATGIDAPRAMQIATQRDQTLNGGPAGVRNGSTKAKVSDRAWRAANDGPSSFSRLQSGESAWSALQRKDPILQRGGLNDQHAQNAARQNTPAGTPIVSFSAKEMEVFLSMKTALEALLN